MSEARSQLALRSLGEAARSGGGSPREGIALIVVLGMLALMVLMGITFSIYMRTERVAAGNYRNDVCVRQLLHVALNRALQDIANNVSANSYPAWDILPSNNGSASISNVMTASALEWIPRAALGTNLNPDLKWIEVQTGVSTNVRVGYLVVNCSGLLDANYAGGLSEPDRLCGTNPAEMQIKAAPEVADETKISANRDYETLQELGVLETPPNHTFSLWPSNFVTFSAFPTGSVVDISGDVATLVSNKASIIAAFARCNLPAGLLFTNLIDYVDEDPIPGNVGFKSPRDMNGNPMGPFVEPIWFCNEVSLSNTIKFAYDGTNTYWTNTISIEYEAFFPFKGVADCKSFRAEISVSYDDPPTIIHPDRNPWVLTPRTSSTNLPYWQITERKFVSGFMNTLPPPPTSIVARVTAKIIKPYNGTDYVVDLVTNVLSVTNSGAPLLGRGTTTYYGWDGRECDDPRMNHNASNWKRPASGRASIRAKNSNVDALWMQDYRDGDLDMYVRNGRLQTVGELGYLFLGLPGETVRLYKHGSNPNLVRSGAHPVFDMFTTARNGTRNQKGCVNLNTRNADVLACVFYKAPIDYPHGGKTKRVTDPLLDDIVKAILAQRSSFTNLSELGRIDWKTLYPAGSGSDQDRESLIRNSAGLLQTRQNLFTILLFAQMTREVAGLTEKSVVAEVRAIAEVWRDPVDDAYFVRTFKILNE